MGVIARDLTVEIANGDSLSDFDYLGAIVTGNKEFSISSLLIHNREVFPSFFVGYVKEPFQCGDYNPFVLECFHHKVPCIDMDGLQ